MAEPKIDGTETKKEEGFKIDLIPDLITIPDFSSRTEINIKYPLMEPYAYAHIHWSKENNELIYEVIEPKLDDDEIDILKLVQFGLEEMINISFKSATKLDVLLEYLEQNVKMILSEVGARISQETYNKIMYDVYRDSIGLNKIDT